ncbi:thiamine pyrophosphate-requiring protein [Saccharopolyspora karakumensis]|uniref:Thiamine pyrophosphate-requiring protein n=1 Tax=Saccharopolyspora karakumensis TaxID=2530386 RepID=A0A4R5BRG2_9PSEU|nr:thiamine pyrophosphate-requiring protein [Saccharopolyspora karakumensis]TDD88579.1 thiamine pyrophosphate-requiring protein [Saccharopolyspora karakumensis]
MADTVADYLLRRLRTWGVEHVFAYPGDGINGILAAWERADNDPRFIQARHEELAAFEAVGYAKFSGEVGVCAATGGPGAIHLLNGLYDAKLDHVPVVALVGQQASTSLGGAYQQEVDLSSLYKDVAEYVQFVSTPQQLPNALDRAMRTSFARRTVTALIIPNDVQEMTYSPPTHAFKMVPSSVGISEAVTTPGEADLERAAEVLNAGERVAIMVGQGARKAAGEVTAVADVLGAGVAKALLGKDVLPDDLPWVTGAAGLLGTRPSWELMRDCDTLLMVGASFPYSQFLPEFEQARAVQIDIDPTMIGMRYPFEVNLLGDARATLSALLPRLRRKQDRAWREKVESGVRDWWEVMERRAGVEAEPLNPERVFHELSPQLPDDAIITADSGSAANWYARHLRVRGRMRCSLSGTLATMGPGAPYATGAKFAHPDRPVIALVGDGAMQMNGINELITIGQHWREWQDPRVVVGVLNNGDLNQVTWEMRALNGAPQFLPSQRLPEFDYAEFARSAGFRSIRVADPGSVADAWAEALSSDRPCLIDFVTDPAVPPIPPQADWSQVESMAEAMLKGDPDAWSVVTEGVKSKAQEFLPRRR